MQNCGDGAHYDCESNTTLLKRNVRKMQKICVRIDFEKRTKNKNKQFKIVQTSLKKLSFFIEQTNFQKDVENTIVFYWTRIFLNKFLKKGSFFTGWKKFSIKNLKKLLLFFWTNNFSKWTINWRNNYTEQTILPNYHSARKWME